MKFPILTFRARVCLSVAFSVFLLVPSVAVSQSLGDIGTFKKWSRVEIGLAGPASAGAGSPNPFSTLVDATFTSPTGVTHTVPGFYDGDGAGEMDGNVWKVRFSADETGSWQFETQSAESQLDAYSGSFTIVDTDPGDADFYRWGRLEYVGTAQNTLRYLKFRDGSYWLKAGCDDPENFLGKFVNYDTVQERRDAVDYLAARGVNSMYMITHNVDGDNEDVWPWFGGNESEVKANGGADARFDVARMQEWLELFEYMQTRGVVPYLVLEDDSSWTGYDHARYYREMVARFGHLPALLFNLGEEYNENYSLTAALGYMQQLAQIDPYDHPRSIHNVNTPQNALIDSSAVHFTSIQTKFTDARNHNDRTIDWIDDCKARGERVLMVNYDEPRPLMDRKGWWSAYIGGGVWELHVDKPYDRPMSTWDTSWVEVGGTRTFMESLPFWTMEPANSLVLAGEAFCLAAPGNAYALYLPSGGSVDVDLTPGVTFDYAWWNPSNGRSGVFESGGSVAGGRRTFAAPSGGDWALRIVKSGGQGNSSPVAASAAIELGPGEAEQVSLSYSDADGPGPYTFTVTEPPSSGSLAGSGPTLTYTADAGAAGSDSFSWKVNDGVSDSNEATVSVTFVSGNQPPVAQDGSATTVRDSAVSIPLAYSDADGPGPYAFTIVRSPVSGSLVADGQGDNDFTYTPDPGFTGSDSFDWKVNDGLADSGTATVTVMIQTTAVSSRVTNGLVVYYPFSEGAGSTVADASENGSPMDLSITGAVSWVGSSNGVVMGGGRVGTTVPAGKLIGALQAMGRSTFEVWLAPADLAQTGPARMISIGGDLSSQNYVLGQDGGDLEVRLSHSGKDAGARPRLITSSAPLTTSLIHVVHTFDGASERLYLDGVEQPTVVSEAGDYSSWDPNDLFSLGSEAIPGREWLGTLRLAAVYDRGLTVEEIGQNFAAGPDGNAPVNQAPVVEAGADQTTALPAGVQLTGEVSDDGLPLPAQLSVMWAVISGPGPVTFADPATATATVSFDVAGVYVLQLTADDGASQSSDSLTVTVEPEGIVARVTDSLVVFYPFTEGSGATVSDQSSNGAPMDLTITGVASWSGSWPGVVIDAGRIGTAAPATKVIDALQSTGRSTFEIWAAPGDLDQDGPARLISIGGGLSSQNYMLGQAGGDLEVRLLHTGKDVDAHPRLTTSSGPLSTSLTHVVHTFDGTTERLFLDGVEQPATVSAAGDYSNWDPTDLLSIGNEATPGREWRGAIRLVAVYERALTVAEVQQNLAAGAVWTPVPNLAAQVDAGPDQTVVLPSVVSLDGTVTDDGLPLPTSLTTSWSVSSGPGTVTFADASQVDTTAAFGTDGSYVLRLTADDGEFEAEDELTVTVSPEPPAAFVDVTQAAGTAGPSRGGHGAMFADVNGDDLPDLYITINDSGVLPDYFFLNTGNGVFADQGVSRGIDDLDGGSHGAAWSDLDNDGDYDLFNGTTWNTSGGVGNPDHDNVYENDGSGFFSDVTPASILAVAVETRGVITFDWDADGRLDVYGVPGLQTPGVNEAYRNDGGLGFTEITSGGLTTARGTQGVTDTDFDGDGDVDVLVANRLGDIVVLENDGSGGFTEIDRSTIGISDDARDGITTADIDNDGDLDLLLSGDDVGHLYTNDGAGTFSFSQTFTGTAGYMGAFADLDHDTDLDLVFAGDELVYLNQGGGNFAAGPAVPVTGIADPRAVAFADIDEDGDLDFAIAAKSSINWMVRNDLASGNWLKVKLIAANGQAGAFGAKTRVYPAGDVGGTLLGLRESKSNQGYLGQDDPMLHFGLGATGLVDVVVEFLDGSTVIQPAVAANQIITISGIPFSPPTEVPGTTNLIIFGGQGEQTQYSLTLP